MSTTPVPPARCRRSSRHGLALCVIDHDAGILDSVANRIRGEDGFERPLLLDRGKDVLARMRRFDPEMILLDVLFAAESGFRFLRAIRDRFPDAQLVIMAPVECEDTLLRAISAGADGCIVKPLDMANLPDQLRSAGRGEPLIPESLARRIVHEHQRRICQPKTSTPLSANEWRLLELTSEGKTCREIGVILGVSTSQVYAMNKALYTRLNINSRVAAVAWHRSRSPRQGQFAA